MDTAIKAENEKMFCKHNYYIWAEYNGQAVQKLIFFSQIELFLAFEKDIK